MESYQRESMRRIRRNSKTLLQDLFCRGVHGGGRDTPIPAQPGRDAKMIHSIASLIRAKSKLLLLESPDTVEIYKLDDPTARSTRAGKDVYLPAITAKASSLTSLRGSLSQSCPYLYDKRRASFSSVVSQRTSEHAKKQSNLKAQREAKKSNVTVTMTYLGQGHRGSGARSTPDDLKVLQQVNGGENICVFKGLVAPGAASQKHSKGRFSWGSTRLRQEPRAGARPVQTAIATENTPHPADKSTGFQGKDDATTAARVSPKSQYSMHPCICGSSTTKPPDQGSPILVLEGHCPAGLPTIPGLLASHWLNTPDPEQFRFVSQRHKGFPFSASLYANGIMVARISSCCEYRYAPGFQQGRKSCFRLTWLAGGIPCYRCTSLRNKYSSCQQLSNDTKENLILPVEQSPGNGAAESCPSSPLFVPVRPAKTPVRRTRKHIREAGAASTDSEDQAAARNKETSEKKRLKSQTNRKESRSKSDRGNRKGEGQDKTGLEVSESSAVREKCDGQVSSARPEPRPPKTTGKATRLQTQQLRLDKANRVTDSLQEQEALTKQNGEKQKGLGSYGKSRDGERLRDFYEECVQMSAGLERGPNKHNWFKANILERCRLQKKLSSCPKAAGSDLELSAESDTVLQPDGEPEEGEDTANERAGKEEAVQEQDLQAQLDAMMTVLSTSDEVAHLVLKNTGLTDELLLSLAGSLKSSSSEVTLLNLNLNLIGPYGAIILLDILRAKPQVKGLHLFGNKLRDHGVLTLLNGIAELQEQTARAAAAVQQAMLFPSEQHALPQLPTGWSAFRVFTLLELDIGGNGLSSEGVKVLASYVRHHSYLQYLGLAQTSGADLAAWKELFDSLKGSSSLTQIILDENNLGDPGVRLLADVLKENASLREVDLDRNDISDVGGNDIMGALLCRTQSPLGHLSLDENSISAGLMSRIQEEVKRK